MTAWRSKVAASIRKAATTLRAGPAFKPKAKPIPATRKLLGPNQLLKMSVAEIAELVVRQQKLAGFNHPTAKQADMLGLTPQGWKMLVLDISQLPEIKTVVNDWLGLEPSEPADEDEAYARMAVDGAASDQPPVRFRLRRKSVGRGVLSPLPGKQFSPQELEALKLWVQGLGPDVQRAYVEGNGVMVILRTGDIEDFFPKEITVKEQKAEKERLLREEQEAERGAANTRLLETSPAAAWIKSVFGANFANQFNQAALTRFLDGADKKFQGLVGHTWVDGFVKLGLDEDRLRGMDVPELMSFLKDAYETANKIKSSATSEGEEWVRSRIQAMNPIREGMDEADYQGKVNEFMAKSQIRELVQDISEMLNGKPTTVAALRRVMTVGSSWKATALSPKKDMGTRQVSQARSSDIKMLKEDGQETTLDLGGADVYQRGDVFFVSWPEMLNVVKYEPAEFSADKAQQAREDRERQQQEDSRLRQEKQDAAEKAAKDAEAALWDGFLVGLPNLKRGQAKKSLDKLIRMNNQTAKTGDHIREMVAKGYRVDGDRFWDKDRSTFYDKKVLGALPFLYAVFLAEKTRSGSAVRAAMSDSEFWDVIADIGWDGKSQDWDKIKKKLLTTLSPDQVEGLSDAFSKAKNALSKKVESWEKHEEINAEDEGREPRSLGVSDDSYSDLLSHVVGLGKAEYGAAMKDPELVYERAAKHKFMESFSYAIPYKGDIENITPKKYIAWAQNLVDEGYPLGESNRVDSMGQRIQAEQPKSSAGKAAVKVTQQALKLLADGDVAGFLGVESEVVPAVTLLDKEIGSNKWAVLNLYSDIKKYLDV